MSDDTKSKIKVLSDRLDEIQNSIPANCRVAVWRKAVGISTPEDDELISQLGSDLVDEYVRLFREHQEIDKERNNQ